MILMAYARMGDAQASSDEAMLNFRMDSFYESFLRSIRDDQLRYNENHATDTGLVDCKFQNVKVNVAWSYTLLDFFLSKLERSVLILCSIIQ